MWLPRHSILVAAQGFAGASFSAPTRLIHVNLRRKAACHFRGIAHSDMRR
jgi:hypothetical protein